MHTAQTCDVLDAHSASSWWYSWGLGTGFDGSFCDAPDDAAARARASMDFVPMFWGESHIDDFLAAPEAWHHELDRASYLLTFNEPEFAAQANISPRRAAQLWPTLVEIAQNYSLELVAPCVSSGVHGERWWAPWQSNCTALHGSCEFDYGCTHNYFQPAPCRDDVSWWACVGNGDDGTEHLEQELQTWYEHTGGKPIWVTEFACNPWAERACNASSHRRLMDQVVPVLEASPRVFRYAWFAAVWKSNFGRPVVAVAASVQI